MKLNLIPLPKSQPKPAKVIKATGYESPINWWEVTTDGDCEGRSTKNLGIHYGHVAEIALSLQEGPCYDYTFTPAKNWENMKKGNRPKLPAQRKIVHIGLNIDSKTWDLKRDERAKWFTQWLDCEDILVTEGCYYKAVQIELK